MLTPNHDKSDVGAARWGRRVARAAVLCALGVTVVCARSRAEEPAAPGPASRPAEPTTRPGAAAPGTGRITNLWVDTDVRQVMRDISSQADVAVLCDPTVQGAVSLAVKDMSVEECLERVCSVGGYTFVKVKDYYVVGREDPGGAMFQQVAAPVRIKLSYATCDQVRSMLHSSLAPYVTFDKPTGAVLITAPPAARQRAMEAIKLIDHPIEQIAVEAVVFELTEDGSKQLGLDWQYKKANLAARLDNLVGMVTFEAASDLGTYIELTLQAIIQDRKGQVLANPRLLVMNGQEADIFVGREKYFSLLSGQPSNPYYRLESIKAGVALKVAPRIGDQGQIVLQLEPEVSDVVTESSRDTLNNGGDNANSPLPVVTRRRVKTTVSIKDGETVVIGGLLREHRRSIVEKVPVLGDVPGLGTAFRRVDEQKEQQEVVILITARITDESQPPATSVARRLEQRYVGPLDAITVPKGVAKCSAKRWPFWPR
jgi:type IV pilus assembly protein PilQ